LGEKAKNFFFEETDLKKADITTVPSATKVEFSEIKYQGNVNVTLNTPAGATQTFTITDQMAYDLFQNPTFQKLNQSALQNAMSQPQYSALPNLTTK
jgi:predicted dienelactone hydrolase